MMPFALSLPGETRFGWGVLAELPGVAGRLGPRVALARGGASLAHTGVLARVHAMLSDAGITVVELPPQTREPEPADVDAAVAVAQAAGVTGVLALGGGSVLDLGKAVAALVPQHPVAPVRAYLEGLGEGRTLETDPLPWIAIPTTAGTGTEATKNAVISSQVDGFKKSLRDRRMLAAVALIDPEPTCSVPPDLTAYTGADALTQLIEAYTSRRAQPVTDALAVRGLQAARLLPQAYHQGTHHEAREAMALAAYLSGVCLANAGLGAAHGIAAALGSVAPIAHGLACALALPWVMAVNASVVPERYAHIAEILTGTTFPNAESGARAAIDAVWALWQELAIPRAAEVPELAGVLDDAHLPALAARCQGNSLQGNPRPLSEDELMGLLRSMRDEVQPVDAGKNTL